MEDTVELLDRNHEILRNGIPTEEAHTEQTVLSQPVPSDDSEAYLSEKGQRGEEARYDAVRSVAQTGNALKLEELLAEWKELGWLRDWRNEEDLTLYADAITDGFIDVINVLLVFYIPLGDALIRAIDVEFDEAVRVICQYLQEPEQADIRESILNGICDNDDFHPAITPLVLAAQRNNFEAVKLLLGLGAKLDEPTISPGGDVTLTQAISTLHIYRGLSQPAYILNTQTDVFGHAFEISKKLRTLSMIWEDFGAEYEEMARGVEVFAGEMLGQSSSTEEILALFQYHNTDKYRNVEGKQHPLAKLFEAINFKQKEFIAHPHSQKAIIAQFYQNLLSWNEKGLFHQILLTLLVLLGYPIICLLYILFPIPKVVKFARLPYVMMLMKAGSGFTFLVFVIAASVIDKYKQPRIVDTLHWLIFIWIIGLMWMHIKIIMKHGRTSYLSDSANIHEAVIIALYFTVFFLQWNGRIDLVQFVRPQVITRSVREATDFGTFTDNNAYSDIQSHVTSVLNGLQGKLNRTVIEGVNGIIASTLSHCRLVGSVNVVAEPSALLEFLEYDAYEPALVAEALFGVTITVSFLRLLNLLLVSDAVGPLRISLGAMTGDILKFLAIFLVIWLAFGIGLFQNFYSAGQSMMRACLGDGGEHVDCELLVGFSSFIAGMIDLYWSLFGMIGTEILVLPAKQSVAETVGTSLFVCYHIVAVLVLLNALIGMLSNTYNNVEEDADTEWKFHRAAVWGSYLRPVSTLPPPFNLIPSIKSIWRLIRYIIAQWFPGLKREVVCQREFYNEKELNDYMRVLKLVSSRYIKDNLSTESQGSEGVRPRDLNALRNDILAFKYFVQSRLGNMNTTLGVSNEKTGNIRQKVGDLDPLSQRASELVEESGTLTAHIGELNDETENLNKVQENEISRREEEYAQKTKTIEELRTENEQLRKDLSREIAGSGEKTKTIDKMRKDYGQLEVCLAGERDDSMRKTKTIEELRAKNETLDNNLSMEAMNSSEKSKVIDKLQSENKRLEESLLAEGSGSTEKAKAMQELLARTKKLEIDYAREVLNSGEKENTIVKLRDDNARLEESLSAQREECADKTKIIAELQDKIDNKTESDKTSKTVEQLRAENESLEVILLWERADSAEKTKTIGRLQDDIKQLRDDLSSERTSSVDNAKKLDDLEAEIEKLEALRVANLKDSAQKQNWIDELQNEIGHLRKNLLAQTKDSAEKSEKIQELGAVVKRLEGSLSAKKTDSLDMTKTVNKLQSEIVRLESSLSKKIIEAVQKNNMIEKFKTDTKRLDDMLSRKVRESVQKDKTIEELRAEKAKLSSELKDAAKNNKTIEDLKAEMKQLQSSYSVNMLERDKLEARLSDTIKILQDEVTKHTPSSRSEKR